MESSTSSQPSYPTLSKLNRDLLSNPVEKSEAFAEHFAAVSTLPASDQVPPISSSIFPAMRDIKISTRAVRKAFQAIDINKAVGPDEISPVVLKHCAPELAPVFCYLFNRSINDKVFPDLWKQAHITPIHKKGDRTDINNYRPISITSCISKVFEGLVNTFILLADQQYGFRRARSTGDLLTFVTHLWSSAIEAFGETRVVALDISKAFDRVWHAGLLNKLPSYGFTPNLCSWINNYLSGRSLRVRVDGCLSSERKFNSGVPQGCVLSPTLFIIFINDLLSITKSRLHAYADDSTLHCSSIFRNQADCRNHLASYRINLSTNIQTDIKSLEEWGVANRVSFNASKTNCITISTKKDRSWPDLSMSNNSLHESTSISMLGVTISSSLSWIDHIQNIAKAAARKLNYLFRAKHYFDPSSLHILYKAQVRPLLEYSSHIWGATSKSSSKTLGKV